MNDDIWYFAYGSNLSRAQMETRTLRKRQAVRCYLQDYRLAFNKDARNYGEAYANIMPSKGDRVWGVIYLCDYDAMERLDCFEGVRYGDYYRMLVEVVTDDGRVVMAVAYVAGEVIPETQPGDWYLYHILMGAKEHALPEEYIEQIKSIADK